MNMLDLQETPDTCQLQPVHGSVDQLLRRNLLTQMLAS